MASRLVLVRHGRSALATRVGWIDADGVNRWRVEYDAAGIACADEPPAELRMLASNADVVCASDMARAIASAERLAPRRQPALSPLLRESTLAVTHGVVRRLLARALVERNWRRDRRAGSYEHWSAWTFERE